MITLVEVLLRTEGWLRERGITPPRLEAELLIGHALGLSRMQLYLAHDRPMADEELARVRELVRRRGDREPMAYILGSAGFHAIDLHVEPGVLVPRPDTEALVDAALEWLGPAGESPLFVADVGSGTGAVGLAIAQARPDVRLYAIDVSPIALALTRKNVKALGLDARVGVLEGSLLDPVPTGRTIDWVVSNPPYIPSREIDTLMPEVSRWEPRLALDGGPDGLDVYRALVPAARRRARRGLLLEVGHDQSGLVSDLLRKSGFVDVRTWTDLGGHQRVVGGRVPS